MNSQDLQSKKTDDYLKLIVSLHEERELKKYESVEKPEFSAEHKRKMSGLHKRYRRKVYSRRVLAGLSRVAAFVLILTLVGAAVTFSVSAFRVRFYNYFFSDRGTNTQMQFNSELPSEVILNDYPGLYVLSPMPEGYNLLKVMSVDGYYKTIYTRVNDSEQVVLAQAPTSTSLRLDTEGVGGNIVDVTGHDVFFSQKDNLSLYVWAEGGYTYRLSGSFEQKWAIELIKNFYEK